MFLISIVQTVYDAVTEIFNKYLPMMKSLAKSLLNDDQLSEDAVQEALVRLSQNTHKIDNINSNAGKNYITTGWWVSTFAGIATIITVVIFYLLGDGMNHVLNPKYSFGKGGGK